MSEKTLELFLQTLLMLSSQSLTPYIPKLLYDTTYFKEPSGHKGLRQETKLLKK